MCVCECVSEEKRRGKRPTSSFFPDSVNTNTAVQRGLEECFGAFRECESNYDFCLYVESQNRHAERSDTLSAERLRVPTIRPVRAQADLNSGCTLRGREGMKWGGQRSLQQHRGGFFCSLVEIPEVLLTNLNIFRWNKAENSFRLSCKSV